MDSIDYYNQNAQAFFDRTIDVDRADAYAKFLPHLVPNAKILDAGCGSGRDTLYFKKYGFEVVSFDASIEMVKISSKLTGVPTLHLRFQELAFEQAFDAIWASASLLHTPYEELSSVFQKLHQALKPSGILYASFKYGDGSRESDSRMFYDMNELSIESFIMPFFTPKKIWRSPDTGNIAVSPCQAWLNILIQNSL